MRRAALTIALTIAGLVLLLSFRTDLAPMMQASSPAPSGSELTGTVLSTADGLVQVQVTVSSGKITRVSLPVQPHRRRRARARARERAALARLIKETLAAQGADIDKVAGSGSLSSGYIKSLRSALRHALGGRRASAGRTGSGHHHGRRKGDRRHGGGAGQPGGQ